jgi:hypothetical protein
MGIAWKRISLLQMTWIACGTEVDCAALYAVGVGDSNGVPVIPEAIISF